ncbi:hypothetical protein UAW_02965 [Enterococcus haemoperoxidus ATCC BAA-382]|uniref:Uncharacterized protein n=1 Tax=Enterococcus haemoperoxidus ATCC BAA-382 TaxID=1158608 RepID=R2SY70_9ENTE|nr:hypothetical protein [Enterococcus haemoperoxidus]EOH92924.1 hypothetical protein UAW_02965 [Enterococcus haemoperoxidus ATCC BAA-382]EOT61667.1 hypothetical protein I583_00649 [Enterococcus haemoperoxidus ATCC BAA-382]
MKISRNNFGGINNSTVVIGNNNRVSNGKNEEIDWEKFSAELMTTLTKLPQNSEEFRACTQLLVESTSKDEGKVSAFLKKHAPQFTSDVFSNLASTLLADTIKKLMVVM